MAVYIGLELNSYANLTISTDSIGFLLQFRALTGTLIAQSEIWSSQWCTCSWTGVEVQCFPLVLLVNTWNIVRCPCRWKICVWQTCFAWRCDNKRGLCSLLLSLRPKMRRSRPTNGCRAEGNDELLMCWSGYDSNSLSTDTLVRPVGQIRVALFSVFVRDIWMVSKLTIVTVEGTHKT